jgi:hypothetical protein
MDIPQDTKEFIRSNDLDKDETEGFDEISLEDWQDKCSQLVDGVWQYTKRIELRIASIEYRLDRLEERDRDQKVDNHTQNITGSDGGFERSRL